MPERAAEWPPTRQPGPVEYATVRTLAELPIVSPSHESLAATAVILARTLDEGAGMATAAVSRELRATMDAITKGDDLTDDLAAAEREMVARLRAPVGDTTNE